LDFIHIPLLGGKAFGIFYIRGAGVGWGGGGGGVFLLIDVVFFVCL
jgi:hypothetical protein